VDSNTQIPSSKNGDTCSASRGFNVPQFPKRPAITASALLVLFIAFFSYVFAIGVAVASVYFPLLLLTFLSNRGQFVVQGLLLVLGGMAIAGLIFWSIFPRKQTFVEPGVALNFAHHPRLGDLINDVADHLGERPPHCIYLTLHANASVTETGGWFGLGSKRVLTVGLPLLVALNESELRFVLAHEFAHYYGGDTILLPLEQRARTAMGRTLEKLYDSDLTEAFQKIGIISAMHAVVSLVMSFYWRAFMRLSSGISRAQEFRCDELACYIAGADAGASALEQITRIAAVESEFWRDVILPLLERRVLPSISTSLREYLTNPDILDLADEVLRYQLTQERLQTAEAHPPLAQRLHRIRRFQGIGSPPLCKESPICFLSDVDAQELALVAFFFIDADEANEFKRLSWNVIAEEVYVPEWRSFVDQHHQLLRNHGIADVPKLLNNPDSLMQFVPNPPGRLLTREQRAETAREVIIAASLLRLLDIGWTYIVRPGVEQLVKGPLQLQPWRILRQRPSNQGEWEALCEKEGLLGQPLYIRGAARH
jgi:heat shock protein HtpX